MQFLEFLEPSSDDDIKQSSRNIEGYIVSPVPDSGCCTEPNYWPQTNFLETNAMETENFQEIFGGLMDIDCHPILQATSTNTEPKREFPWEPCKGESSGSKKKPEGIPAIQKTQSDVTGKLCGQPGRKKHDQRSKRTRSAKMHNVSERRRRDRIKGKLRALQELIPNCHKDRASMLEDAVKYLKALKLQVEMLSMGGGAMCQGSFMPQAGIPSVPIPQCSPYVPMRPSPGMGMFSMSHSLGFPMMSLPSAAYLHPSLSAAAAGLNPMAAHGNLPTPQLQMPFVSSQTSLPADHAATSSTLPTFATGFSPTYDSPDQGDQSSPQMQRRNTI